MFLLPGHLILMVNDNVDAIQHNIVKIKCSDKYLLFIHITLIEYILRLNCMIVYYTIA